MQLKKHKIPFTETGQFSRLFIDYINGDKNLRQFYGYTPDIDSFKQAMKDRSGKEINRKLLADVIREQYNSHLKVPIADLQQTNSNIELLVNENTFTVCTGHQLCLFTGPLYFIYKIISTVNLAEALKKKYPDNNFVPVYWMASEDHDFAEISSVNLFGKKIRWGNTTAKGPVGRLGTETLSLMIEELKSILGESENGKELIRMFTDAYIKHPNLADATRYLIHEIFGTYGLVIIDADDPRLKSEFIDIIKDDITNKTNHKIVTESIKQLNALGYDAQVNPREINLFRLTDNDRIRIEQSTSETLNYDAGEYSPNVVLRPLYQQKILPNLAYVGGPGEIAYWLEYKAMFDHHNILFPILIPRNFALLSDEKTEQQMQKLGLSRTDIFKDIDLTIKEFVKKHAGSDVSLKEQEQELTTMFSDLAAKVNAVDATLKASVEAEFQKAMGSLKNIENKLIKSEKQKQEININQIRKVKEKFLPEGILQERYDNFSPYYLKYGKELIPLLKEAFEPFEFEMLILE